MKDDFPLFKNMESYGFYEQLSEEELNYVFFSIFGEPVVRDGSRIYNQNKKQIYREYSKGVWYKSEYDENGNEIYSEYSNGYWVKREYDNNGNEIYYETSDGYWYKYEYDENGKRIYYEDSHGRIKDYR